MVFIIAVLAVFNNVSEITDKKPPKVNAIVELGLCHDLVKYLKLYKMAYILIIKPT